MFTKLLTIVAPVLFVFVVPAFAGYAAHVFFSNLTDGAEVSSPFLVEMGVDGYTLAPAGEDKEGVGHHHIIIDGGFVPKGETIPADEKHLHFGKGQTSATLTLPPGEHQITLQFADGLHRSYGEALSASIKVKVR